MKYEAGFIGAGNMGGALLRAVTKTSGGIAVFDTDAEKAFVLCEETGAIFTDAKDLFKNSKYIFMAVKPNIISAVLKDANGSIGKDSVIVSMAAGVSVKDVKTASGFEKVIRIMPNTPCAVGEGMILYTPDPSVSEAEEKGFLSIMKCAGKLDKIEEKYIDAAAAVSGCGPAFVYMFIEALADGAVACGLPRDKALDYAKQTVLGSATLAIESKKHPGQLKDDVCSPGGTTIEGVLALEDGAFRAAAASAVIAEYEKKAQLKK